MEASENPPLSSSAEVPASVKKQKLWPGDHIVDLDLRSLALLRIAIATLLFLDTAVRATDITAFYSDFGSLPRGDLLRLAWEPYWFSLHMATGATSLLTGLLGIQLLCAVGLFIGWKTRWMTFSSWLLLVSIHSRNPVILNGGDVYLRVILFWMLFLPWGQTWSLDARAGKSDTRWWTPAIKADGKAVRSLACLAVLLQICYVYWFAVLARNDPSWTTSYTATSLALRLETFITPLGVWVRDTFWAWLPILTMLVIFWEFCGPFFLLFPFDRGQIRTLGVLGFGLMHAGFGLCMHLGLFAWIGICMSWVLLPSWFWDKPARRLTAFMDARWSGTWKDPHPFGDELVWRWFPREFFFYVVMLYTLLWNLGNENCTPNVRLSPRAHGFAQLTRLDQRWNMFSPAPLTDDGWYVIEGTRRDGTTVDVLHDVSPVDWSKPAWIATTYKNERWRKYMMNLWSIDNQRYRLPFAQYLTRLSRLKNRGLQELVSFDIYFMREVTNPDGSENPPEKVLVWHHECFAPSSAQSGKKPVPVPKPPSRTKATSTKMSSTTPESKSVKSNSDRGQPKPLVNTPLHSEMQPSGGRSKS